MHVRRLLGFSLKNDQKLISKINRCIIHTTPETMDTQSEVNEVFEGLAKVAFPKSVFYNPVQEYNRDLSIVAISEFVAQHFKDKKKNKKSAHDSEKSHVDADEGQLEQEDLQPGKKYTEGVRIYEGLAASGLRSVRFGLEIPGVNEIVANDLDSNAVKFIEGNIHKNGLQDIMKSRLGDAAMGMYESRSPDKMFDVIDLDPYGSPTIFLDAAVQAVRDGGLLCITCTDAAVLCGNAPEKCSANYGAFSLRSKACHEMALRIILQCVDSHANRYGRYIEPLLSVSVDFYFRVFVRVKTSQRMVKHSVTKRAMVFECSCGTYALQPIANAIPTKGEGNFKFVAANGPAVGKQCEHCGHGFRIGGPIWSAPIHDRQFVQQMLKRIEKHSDDFKTSLRMDGMLNVVLEELPDVPLYYDLSAVCGGLHCRAPSMTVMRSALLNAGYKVSLSHAAKNSYKTDAPAQIIWDIMRAWVKDHPVSQKRLVEGSVSKTILDQPSSIEVSFEEHPEANPQSREKKLLRWQMNPEPFWGPKAKAKRSLGADPVDKRSANQGKSKKKCTTSHADQSSSEQDVMKQ